MVTAKADPSFLGIDHVQLAAPPGCEAAARRFFGELLGLTELPKPSVLAVRGGVWFACGSQQVHVGVEKDFQAARKAHPAFRLSGSDALCALRERLVSGGASVRDGEPVEDTVRFFADDPWGNRLEFLADKAKARV
jgi:hypothetical protein